MVDIKLRVHRRNAARIRHYAESLEDERNFTIAEAFPDLIGQKAQVALRAYRHREDLTQKQLSELVGIPQHHISEMETGKRAIGKLRAQKLAAALNCDYRRLL
jgi:DNA-binding XRE family transcriptional regulator